MKKTAKSKTDNNFLTTVATIFELPAEVISNIPLTTITGNNTLIIENYIALVEYTPTQIRINTTLGITKIDGGSLQIDTITKDYISISGYIKSIEYSSK